MNPAPLVNPLHTGDQFKLPPPPALASALSGLFTPNNNNVPASSLASAIAGKVGIAAPGMSLADQRKLRRRPVPGAVKDGVTYGVLTMFKTVRIMVLWIALYFVDRAYQSAYLSRVMVRDEQPPSLLTVAAAALAIEAVFALIFIGFVSVLSGRFKNNHNTFALDGPLISALWAQYLQSTIVILALGTLLGRVAQSRKNLRYGEDGMRGIRALCTAIMLVSVVVIVIL
jgi:hypothetical protein